MNNGNFFPNFNIPNNEASLNSMNMQSIGGQPESQPNMYQQPQMPQPDMSFAPNNQEMYQQQPVPGPMPQPDFNQQSVPTAPEIIETPSTIPSFNTENYFQPEQAQPQMMPEQNMNFQPQDNAPVMPEVVNNSNETPTYEFPQTQAPQMQEAPLFNPGMNNSEQIMPQPDSMNNAAYEVPISEPLPVENQPQDRLTQVEQVLNTNGIEYKAYSNENGHCIIIEI